MPDAPPPPAPAWDAVIIGGALSGSATALLLRRRNPKLRILVLERSFQFKRRVGESTVEISAYFLGRVLGLTAHLNEHHLVKQGLRFWFANDETTRLTDCSETGPAYNVRFPGYQVDRAVLDEHLLAQAAAEGVTVRRGWRVRDVALDPAGPQTLTVENADGGHETLTTKWVVDASGFAALLGRREGWITTNTAHPIAAVWSRWSGVRNWDDPAFAAAHPEWSARTKAVRFTATNHFVGRGWWAWCIPLKGGDTSIGIVYDQRLTELPAGPHLGDRLKAMLDTHPAARELLADATWHEGDVTFRRHLAYQADRVCGPGYALVGDAAAFMDPFYSPGMDWIAYTTTSAAALIDSACRGRPPAERIARQNRAFTESYTRWFRALYQDKYYYMGDRDLMTLAFRLDLGTYYLGVVAQPFRHGARALEQPPFSIPGGRFAAAVLATYNRRFAQIARDRLRRGSWGRRNRGHYHPFNSYVLGRSLGWRVAWAFAAWGALELREGWRTWFQAAPAPAAVPPRPSPKTAAPPIRAPQTSARHPG